MDRTNQTPRTIGLPRMMKEQGERRVFLPEIVQFLAQLGIAVAIEEGYGSRSGFTEADYIQPDGSVHFVSREEAFSQEVVLVLRSPTINEFSLMKPGTILISMLHFPTRPRRVKALQEVGIQAISLDSIVNDQNLRLVENMKAVAWNGLETAFDVIEKESPELFQSDSPPIKVLVFGTGMVGKHAVDAATKMGNIERNNAWMGAMGPGVIVQVVGRNLSKNAQVIETLFNQTDILVDATQRRDTSRPVICNQWLDWLPEHAVVTDLAVDPYAIDMNPPVVRGIEGIPQGNLNQFIFHPDDPQWGDTVPQAINSEVRRKAVSCYSWPGIHPEACMRHYAQQLEPLLEVLFEKGYENLSLKGDYFERALYRGSLKYWINTQRYGPRPR